MDWIAAACNSGLETLAWLARLGVIFGVLAFFMPCNRSMYWWKRLRAARTDLVYWFVTPLVARVCRTFLLTGGIALLFGDRPPGFAALRELPLWQQCLAIVAIQDVMLYWIHRAFHTRPGWGFHAVHHSPTVLDWMSAGRTHFVNYLLTVILADVVVQLMGFTPLALFVLVPFNVYYSGMVHANLNWTFGPLRYVFASPVFHRWHHTMEEEGLDKNFASTFPILDLIFGTFHMPPGKLPEHFGQENPDFPEGFLGQLAYPFRRRSSPRPASAEEVESPSRRQAA
jgi:sterol desaturase/sphingolipid hydroxylase (fatty acid hydroxylase superfamily)